MDIFSSRQAGDTEASYNLSDDARRPGNQFVVKLWQLRKELHFLSFSSMPHSSFSLIPVSLKFYPPKKS